MSNTNGTEGRLLWSADKTYEQIIANPLTAVVIYNLHEDLLCVQEELQELKDMITPPNLKFDIEVVNYIVTTNSFKGTRITECETIKQVDMAIGDMSFGGTYDVSSPTGKSLSEFIPF